MAKKQGATYRAEMACVHLLAWEAALIVAVEAVLTRREDDKILGGLREYEDVNECVNRISRAESVIALAMLFTDSGMDIRLKKDDRVEHYSGSTRSSLRREYCQWAPQLNGGIQWVECREFSDERVPARAKEFLYYHCIDQAEHLYNSGKAWNLIEIVMKIKEPSGNRGCSLILIGTLASSLCAACTVAIG